jgi:hypothetical protein
MYALDPVQRHDLFVGRFHTAGALSTTTTSISSLSSLLIKLVDNYAYYCEILKYFIFI